MRNNNDSEVIITNPNGKCLCDLTAEDWASIMKAAISEMRSDLANVNQLHNPFWCKIPGNENERYEPLKITIGTFDKYGNDHSAHRNDGY